MSTDLEVERICDHIWSDVTAMELLTDRTERTGVEHAVTICSTPAGYRVTEPCSGTACSANPPECLAGERHVADVHTHPGYGNRDFSLQDYVHAIHHGLSLHCVASKGRKVQITPRGDIEVKENVIKCERLDRIKGAELRPSLDAARNFERDLIQKYQGGPVSSPEYERYSELRQKWLEEADKLKFRRSCDVPAWFGAWERVTERKLTAPAPPPPAPPASARPSPSTVGECEDMFTRPDLEQALKAYDLSTSGSKRELCRRLVNFVASEAGTYPSHWVKERQTPEERRQKYQHVLDCGGTRTLAERARDWTWGHVETLCKTFQSPWWQKFMAERGRYAAETG